MAFYQGHVDDGGTEGIAHHQMLDFIAEKAVLTGWEIQRYTTPGIGTSRELILKGEGLGGDREIFIGFRTYEDVSADYYNLSVAGFTGYAPGSTWSAQPGFLESGVPAHNQQIDYWLAINAQRIALAMKVGTPVYESAYAGLILPYATPGQYPYALCVGGMLSGAAATRYSDTSHSMPYKGSRANFRLRFMDGTWKQPQAFPWNNSQVGGATSQLRDMDDHYPVLPIVLCETTPNIYGELDGIGYVSNFNNTVESTVNDGAEDWVCIQDVARTSFNDYYAMRMD